MRANDVTGALPDENECGGDLLLRLSGSVLRGPGVDKWRDTWVKGDEVVADEERPTVRCSMRESQ